MNLFRSSIVFTAGGVLAVSLAASLPAHAQSGAISAADGLGGRPPNFPAPKGPTPRTPDGHPDLTAYWVDDGHAQPHGNLGKDYPGFKLPFTPAGETAHAYNVAHTVDPESLCLPGGLPREDIGDGGFQLVQAGGTAVFLYGYGTHRVVAIDGREHTDDPDPTFFGEGVGTWEGNTLVIDSIAFKDAKTWADENADPHSDALHTVERWTRSDAGHLHLELTVDDPKFYAQPLHYQRSWIAHPKQLTKEQACDENNIDVTGGHLGFGPGPIRADGTRGYDHPAPLLPLPSKEHPAVTYIPE
jgi:hypothetical protein